MEFVYWLTPRLPMQDSNLLIFENQIEDNLIYNGNIFINCNTDNIKSHENLLIAVTGNLIIKGNLKLSGKNNVILAKNVVVTNSITLDNEANIITDVLVSRNINLKGLSTITGKVKAEYFHSDGGSFIKGDVNADNVAILKNTCITEYVTAKELYYNKYSSFKLDEDTCEEIYFCKSVD